jgi:hypothetical protein
LQLLFNLAGRIAILAAQIERRGQGAAKLKIVPDVHRFPIE